MRYISFQSPLVLSGLVLVASAAILTPRWRGVQTDIRTSGLDSLSDYDRQFLETTVGQPVEIKTVAEPVVGSSQPIAVSKKNSWNPNPSWRKDAGWPTSQRPTELRPVTIEKIPENVSGSFPLKPREKSAPPVVGDAIEIASAYQPNLNATQPYPNGEANPNSKIIPWSSFVDDSTKSYTPVLPQHEVAEFNESAKPVRTMVQVGSSKPIDTPKPMNITSEQSELTQSHHKSESMSPVDAQRFIRQPKTRR